MDNSLQQACYDALMERHAEQKCSLVHALYSEFQQETLKPDHKIALEIIEPGRPDKPELVLPKFLKKRGIGSQHGRNHLMHAVAHIEFNAINLALDAAYRFKEQPYQFYADWLRVAAEEATHFSLVCDYLKAQGVNYGDFPAHDGLWDMCIRTADNVLSRMALVPRVLEARGLDVTPTLIDKLINANDLAAADVLKVIYNDEIDHVRIGSDWFVFHCKQQNLEPQKTFLDCVETYLHGELRGPFNLTARQQAGFTETELAYLNKNYS